MFLYKKNGTTLEMGLADLVETKIGSAKSTIPCLASCLLLGPQRLEAEKTTDLDISADGKMFEPKQGRHGKANNCRIH